MMIAALSKRPPHLLFRSWSVRLAPVVATLLLAACDGGETPSTVPAAEATPTRPGPDGQTPAANNQPTATVAEPDSGPPQSRAAILRSNEEDQVAQRLVDYLLTLHDDEEVLDVDQLLSRGEVRQLAGYTDELRPSPLAGQAVGPHFNSYQLVSRDGFGFALQVWRYPEPDDNERVFERLRETSVVTGNTRIEGDTAFLTELAGIRQLVFHARRKNAVVSLSCGDEVCPDEIILREVAQRVHGRL